MLTLWDMVDQFMEKSDRNMVDIMAERALKNEVIYRVEEGPEMWEGKMGKREGRSD